MKLISPNHPEIEDVEDAVMYYYETKGYSMYKISRFLGISYSRIRYFLLRAGVHIRSSKSVRTSGAVRVCKGCGQDLPLTDEYYHRDSRAASGFRYYCKSCRSMGLGL